MLRKSLIGIFIGAAVVITSGCSFANNDQDKNKYTATVEAESFYIPAEVSGKVMELNVNQGTNIKSGQKAAQIETTAYELQKKQADAALKMAEDKQGDVPDNAKDSVKNEAQAAVDQAQAAVDLAQLQVSKGSVLTANEGTIVDVYVHKGELVSSGMNIAKAINLNTKYIKIYLEETKRNSIKLGDSIPVYSDDEKIGEGKVIYISPESEFTPKNTETKSDKEKTLFEVKLSLGSNTDAAVGALVDAEVK